MSGAPAFRQEEIGGAPNHSICSRVL